MIPKTRTEAQDRIKEFIKFRWEQINEERNLDTNQIGKREYDRLNVKARAEYVKEKRIKMIEDQDSTFNRRLENLIKEVEQFKNNLILGDFQDKTGLEKIKDFSGKLDITPDLFNELLTLYATPENIDLHNYSNSEFSKLVLTKAYLKENIPEEIKHEVLKKLIFNNKRDYDFSRIAFLIGYLQSEREAFNDMKVKLIVDHDKF